MARQWPQRVVCVKFSKIIIVSVGILIELLSAERVLEQTSQQLDGGAAVRSSARGCAATARFKVTLI
jgi:hypothetical protein